MTSSSHIAAGALAYLVATALAETEISIEGIAVTAFAALLPDIDTPNSSIGRPFFPLARWINRKVGHRTATHSLAGVVGLAVGIWGLIFLVKYLGLCNLQSPTPSPKPLVPLIILGYSSHILVDTFNKTGVELFWPARIRCVFFLNEKCRIKSGGKGDYWFMTICLILSLGMYPLARDGFTLSMHRFFGDIYSVVLDYREYGDKHRIWLDLEGVENISNQKIKGRYEILAICENAAVLIDRSGAKQLVSRTPPLQIYPERVSIEIGEAVRITTQEIDMTGRTFGEIPQFPDAERVLLYGHLTPARFANLSIWQDQFNVLSRSLDKIKLEHAEYRDILDQDLEHVLIREGILVAKIYRTTSGAAVPATQVVAEPGASGIRLVEFRVKPSDHVLMEVGESISVGQPIARADISNQLDELETTLRKDLKRLRLQLHTRESDLAETRIKLSRKREEKARIGQEIARFSKEVLLISEGLRLRKTHDAVEKDEVQILEKIADLEQRVLELEQKKQLLVETADRKRAQLKRDATIQASFTGQILRIDRHPEGEKIRLSALYQHGDQ